MAKKITRWVALKKILKKYKHRIGAEIGCFQGKTTKYILKNLDIELLYCVDPGLNYSDFEFQDKKNKEMNLEKDVYHTFLKNIDSVKDRTKILKMFSSEAVKEIKNESLDFVFIDANHAYEYVKEDILLGTPKIKNGGLLSGHDYGDDRYGVTEAVNELIDKNKINVGEKSIWYLEKNEKTLIVGK